VTPTLLAVAVAPRTSKIMA